MLPVRFPTGDKNTKNRPLWAPPGPLGPMGPWALEAAIAADLWALLGPGGRDSGRLSAAGVREAQSTVHLPSILIAK